MLGQTGGEFDRSVVVIPVKPIAEDVFGRCNYVDTDRGLAALVNSPVWPVTDSTAGTDFRPDQKKTHNGV